MKIIENVQIALGNVRSNLLRTIITMLIISFGIMALVGILTSIDSMLYSLNDSFSNMEANSFRIRPKRDGVSGKRGGRQVKIGDVVTYKQGVEFKDKFNYPSKIALSCFGTAIATAKYGGEKTNPNVMVLGTDENYLNVKSYDIAIGRNFTDTEITSGQNKAIIGFDIVKALFNENMDKAINSIISVGNIKYKIIGVLESKGASMGMSQDRRILIPLLKAKTLYGHSQKNYDITVALTSVEKMNDAISTAIGTFRNIRKLKLSQDNDFEIRKADGLIERLKENTVAIRLSAIGIALITLLGAAIGLMNIMLVSVTERTREIGICKALGATRRNILIQFLTEAVVICQLGGLVGIVFGILIGNILTFFIGGTFLIPWAWIILGITTCLVVGLISGLYPALKASRLDPIESLRYE